MSLNDIPGEVIKALNKGVVIPAMPLALDRNRKLDERRQRALIRYYMDAGAGGLAVGVHTTQFEIRLPKYNLYEPVLRIAAEEFERFLRSTAKPIIRIAGVTGQTSQALCEAELALSYGYHAGLLSLAALKDAPNKTLLDHCRIVAETIPIIGFYLQPAVGGRVLDLDFWRQFSKIENVIAIKIAPFNRYQTLDVVRGLIESGRAGEIALYTGNDDNIMADLITEFRIPDGSGLVKKRIVGGLLGHWAVWTHPAVQLLERIQKREPGDLHELLGLGTQITDCNAAIFDAANNFRGCIVGIHEVLRRQGLLEGTWTLDPDQVLGPGQKMEIDRVYQAYPHLNDDEFIARNLNGWLS